MKKKIILALLLSLSASISFSANIYASDSESANNPDVLDSYPLITYNDMLSGEYAGQIVCIDCIRGKSNYEYDNHYRCGLWYPSGESYIYTSGPENSNISNEDINSPDYVIASASEGDVIRYATKIYDDGSFSTFNILSAKNIDHKDINEVFSSFENNCEVLDYDSFSRNPDSYKSLPISINGNIIQIVEEDYDQATYLLSTDSGYVYLDWHEDSIMRGSRILENDNVSVYGTFAGLKTYSSLSGDKTVPEVNVYMIDLN